MVSTPEPPDPMETAQAQGGMNRDTAVSQQMLNMVDQTSPWGSMDYEQTGTAQFTDSQGNIVDIPQFEATTELSPEQQAIFEQTQDAQGNLAGLASEQSDRMRGYLNEPFEFDNQDAANWAYDLGAERLDPRFDQQREQRESELLARGIRPGSDLYATEMGSLSEAENDAYNQLMLQGRGQAYQEALRERNQPINELTALMSGSQVSQPDFQQTPQSGVAGVDYSGLVQDKYEAELQQSQAGLGGLFGLLGAGVSAFSDARLKTDARRIGHTDAGVPIYVYRYKWGSAPMMGVMAQDVPEAAHLDPSGYLRVDYSQVR